MKHEQTLRSTLCEHKFVTQYFFENPANAEHTGNIWLGKSSKNKMQQNDCLRLLITISARYLLYFTIFAGCIPMEEMKFILTQLCPAEEAAQICAVKSQSTSQSTTVYVPLSELGLSHPPLSPANVPLPPAPGGGAHSPAG